MKRPEMIRDDRGFEGKLTVLLKCWY